MSDKLIKESAHEPFRPKLRINHIGAITKGSPNHNFKFVIVDYRHDPDAEERHLQMGYEYVMSTDDVLDDRSFVPGETRKEKVKPSCITKKTREGYLQVLMKISKDREIQNALKAKKAAEDRYKRSQKSVHRQGNNVKVDGGEISTGSSNSSNVDDTSI